MNDSTIPAAERVAAIAAAAGITMTAAFVPFSQSRNAKPAGADKPWRSLNWRVTLYRNGRELLATDYAQGEGHAPAYNAPVQTHGGAKSLLRERALTLEIETGRRATPAIGAADTFKPGAAIDPPPLVDVLGNLASDASAIDHASFESWADEYGYDSDSRAAESTYRACLAIGLALRAGLGDSVLSELREAAGEL